MKNDPIILDKCLFYIGLDDFFILFFMLKFT
jgi:hypothetical protein